MTELDQAIFEESIISHYFIKIQQDKRQLSLISKFNHSLQLNSSNFISRENVESHETNKNQSTFSCCELNANISTLTTIIVVNIV